MTHARFTILFSLALMICCWSCSKPEIDNFILITVDTTRADHLGAYGNDEGLTPFLDEIANQGAVFTDATGVTPITLPSHSSIFTGRYPTSTGVRNNGSFTLPTEETTLAEILKEQGWNTMAVIAAFPLTSQYGTAQGFDQYDEDLPSLEVEANEGLPIHFNERTADQITDRAIELWQSSNKDQKRFLWVHYFDPHAPYNAPESFHERGDHPYDHEVAFMDAEIGRLINTIAADPNRTMISVIADHGESLGDHGEKTHGVFIYQSTIHVPWILKTPTMSQGGLKIDTPVSQVDLLPTVLSLLSIPQPSGLDGTDLTPLLEGKELSRGPVYAESFLPRLQFRFHELTAWRTGPFKYIEAPQPELYDVIQDPDESRNLHGGHPDEAAFKAELSAFVSQADEDAGERAEGGLSAEAEETLRSLGYFGASSPLEKRDDGSVARDPKTMTTYLREYDQAVAWVSSGKFEQGIEKLRSLVDQAPENFMVHYQIAAGLLSAGKEREALQALEPVFKAAPEFLNAYILQAELYERLGEFENAATSYEAAIAVNPEDSLPRLAKAELWESTGRFEKAFTAWAEAVREFPNTRIYADRFLQLHRKRGSLNVAIQQLERWNENFPGSNNLLIVLGEAYLRDNQNSKALAAADEALSIETSATALSLKAASFEQSQAWDEACQTLRELEQLAEPLASIQARLGRCYAWLNQQQEAKQAFEQAVELDPERHEVYTYRGQWAERLGQRQEALQLYRKALSLNRNDTEAYEGIKRLSS